MQLYDFIEYTNEEKCLVYKHPCQDFNTMTKLIVREGQVAIFLKNGTICDVFQPGRYQLSTENLPLLRKIMSIPTEGESTFSAEVYFISTVHVMSLKWGTASAMELQDPLYKVIVKVGACGEASFRILDAAAFLINLVGTHASVEPHELMRFFRSYINMYIKAAVSQAITHDRVSILELNSHLTAIAESVRGDINKKIERDGLSITYFALENIMIPEDDPSVVRLKDSLSKRADMDILGYNYREERSFDVMDSVAENSGGSGIPGTIVGAGIGLGVAGSVAQTVKEIARPISESTVTGASASAADPISAQEKSETTKVCPKCGASVGLRAKFCSECGNSFPTKRFCPNCGTELSPTAKFCSECGEKIL